MSEVEITLREALPEDSAELLTITQQLNDETDFLVMDEVGIHLTPEMLAINLTDIYESENNFLLLALADDQIIGTASVKAAGDYRIAHVGEVGISILKEYWGIGLGTALLEEVVAWASESGVIRRLELTVQSRNERAVHLYQKLGFVTEGIMERGARTDQGEFLAVAMMGLMID